MRYFGLMLLMLPLVQLEGTTRLVHHTSSSNISLEDNCHDTGNGTGQIECCTSTDFGEQCGIVN